uniref:VWFA domain-containing protein n=1 Tax=Panagrolaimus sp. JU765 TaxID=591449 RepID=A0AC34QGQ3_9BILA
MLFSGILFLLLIPATQACLGLIFIGEDRICAELLALQAASVDIVQNYFSSSGSFAHRAYGFKSSSGNSWIPLQWRTKGNYIAWVSDQQTRPCEMSTGVYYAEPLQDLLNLLKNSTSSNYGLIWAGSSDAISDWDAAVPLAQQVAALNMPTFVWDNSRSPGNNTLFRILTHGRDDRIWASQTLQASVVEGFLLKEAIPLLQQSDCGTVPTPLPFSTTPKPTTTTTTTAMPTTTAPPCSLLVFVEEASALVGQSAKLSFLQLAQQLVNAVNFKSSQRFSIALYGGQIYNPIQPQTLTVFNQTLTTLINTMAFNNTPNAATVYMDPILNQLLGIMQAKTFANVSALFISQTNIKNPSAARAAAKAVRSQYQDVYVIDQSTGNLPGDLFDVLTGSAAGHILNGTSSTQAQLLQTLTSSMISKFNSNSC